MKRNNWQKKGGDLRQEKGFSGSCCGKKKKFRKDSATGNGEEKFEGIRVARLKCHQPGQNDGISKRYLGKQIEGQKEVRLCRGN